MKYDIKEGHRTLYYCCVSVNALSYAQMMRSFKMHYHCFLCTRFPHHWLGPLWRYSQFTTTRATAMPKRAAGKISHTALL